MFKLYVIIVHSTRILNCVHNRDDHKWRHCLLRGTNSVVLNLWACSLTSEHERFTSFSNHEFFNLKSASKSTGPRAILTTKDKRKRDRDRGIQSTVLLTNQSHAELTLKTHSLPQGDDQTFQPSSLNHVFIYTPDAYINCYLLKKNQVSCSSTNEIFKELQEVLKDLRVFFKLPH